MRALLLNSSHFIWNKKISFTNARSNGSEGLKALQGQMKPWCCALLVHRSFPSSWFILRFMVPGSYHVISFKVQKGICLTILDETYVSKIAVLRETNLQDCNPAQIGSFYFYFYFIYSWCPCLYDEFQFSTSSTVIAI